MSTSLLDMVIILAGGSGTRLFPLSSPEEPKQFADLGTGKTLLRQTMERFSDIASSILIVTHEAQREQVQKAASGMEVIILGEPAAKNTAPAIMLALAWMQSQGMEEAVSLVAPADHLIMPVEVFHDCVKEAVDLAKKGHLVTFGIPVTRPHTGYGYIETAEKLDSGGFSVSTFTEKPDLPTAKKYHHHKRYFWNGGIFTFQNACMQEELSRHAPQIVQIQKKLISHGIPKEGVFSHSARKIYEEFPSISIDYAVMEKSRRVAMIVSRFRWSDVGDWDEVVRLAQEGTLSGERVEGGIQLGPSSLICRDSEGMVVHSDRPVVTIGVKDLCIVCAHGYVLVMQQGKAQEVKSISSQIVQRD